MTNIFGNHADDTQKVKICDNQNLRASTLLELILMLRYPIGNYIFVIMGMNFNSRLALYDKQLSGTVDYRVPRSVTPVRVVCE